MAVYLGTQSSTKIKYTGGATLLYNGTNGNGNGNGSGSTYVNTSPTLLSGYITRVNNIVHQLITDKNKSTAKATALERLEVLEQLMGLAHKKGLF